MDYAYLLNEMKMRSDEDVRLLARQYGVELSISEIKALRPLLEDISFRWLFTGVPESFISKIRRVIGNQKTEMIFQKYLDMTK
ncbi:hypothetical protein [Sporosarcina beigongshangi]|uniref:hypothetical protein n=1 Tax=Sporosarcina beigongshangi TaxID=2782538 RepID=UPI001939F2E8|nr:hypothetical protein [Sporosarcina beigongshangi]